MADQKISDLTPATLPLAGTEEVPLRVGSANRRVPVRELGLDLPGYCVGGYYDQCANSGTGGANISTTAGAANRFDLFPFPCSQSVRIEEIGISVTGLVAGANIKIAVYESGADGLPSNLLFETANISATSNGYNSETRDFTFVRGKLYWLGIRHSANATLHGQAVGNCRVIGRGGNSPIGTVQGTVFRRVLTFATPAPATYTADPSELASTTVPSILFKVRSLT